jgi:hypothetical protein
MNDWSGELKEADPLMSQKWEGNGVFEEWAESDLLLLQELLG